MELQNSTTDEDPTEKELNLAKLMKKEYCDNTGKETQPKKAAEVIHKLGKIYRKRSPDKLSLIKSVGLFNAAIVRNPSNLSVKNDLSEICQHILKVANAKVQNADLVKKANEVKQRFSKLRNEVDQLLDNLETQKIPTSTPQPENKAQFENNKVSSVQQINQLIACKYKQIMSGVGQFCEDVMGKPPCEYAIAGMGSLARLEITPYSDFEHVILLCDDRKYKSYLEYFCWYSIIFHTIILNLQETVIYKLDIKVLNKENFKLDTCYFDAFTPEGISFDGMMPKASHFPLKGKPFAENKQIEPELIKPVSEMLKYLDSEKDLKCRYSLSDILLRTCFVFGNQDVFNQFERGVKNKIKQTPKPKLIEDVKQQVKEDLDNYSSRFRLAKLKSEDTINIKQLIYRSSTIFIAALGRINKILGNSSFEMVNEMQRNGEITKTTRDKMNYAIAIACEIRLKSYSKTKCQNDSPISLMHDDETVNQLFDFISEASTIEYFQIAYCLQCEVAKQLNFTKLHFYSDPQIFNIKLGLTFDIQSLKSSIIKELPKFVWDRNQFNFDKCIERLETLAAIEHESTLSDSTNDLILIETLANYLSLINAYDDALEFYKTTLEIHKDKPNEEWNNNDIAMALNNIGNCLKNMQHYEDALIHLKQSLEINRKISLDERKDGKIAFTLNNIGVCFMKMQRHDEALIHLKQSLEVKQNTTLDQQRDGNIAITLNDIGSCLMEMKRYDDALIHLKQSLEIKRNISQDEQKDGNIAITLNNIGTCWMEMQRYYDALIHLKHSHEIYRNISVDERKDGLLAITLNNIGNCLKDMQLYDDAVIHLKQSLEIYRNITLDDPKDGNIAKTQNNIGNCLMKMQRYDDALIHLKESLEINRKISLDERKDGNIALTLTNIGNCLIRMKRYHDALFHYQQSLEIFRNISPDEQKDGNIACTVTNAGTCLLEMRRYDHALIFLKTSLEIKRNISSDEQKDGNIAITLNSIGNCLMEMHRCDDALNYLKQSLEIYQNISFDERKDSNIARTLNNIGNCLSQMQRYYDALIHYQQSLEIFRNISLDVQKDVYIAGTLNNIRSCLMKMKR